LIDELLDHPSGCSAGWAIGAIDRVQRIRAAAHFRKLQPNEAACREVSMDAWLRHVSPSASCKEKGVLCPKVGHAPSVSRENADILSLGEGGAHGQDELSVCPRSTGRVRIAARERVIGRGNRNHFDVPHMNLFKPWFCGVQTAADSNVGHTRLNQLPDGAESLDMKAQLNGRKCHLERLHGVYQPRSRQHDIDHQHDLGLEAFEQAFHGRAKVINPGRYTASFRKDGGTRLGQRGFPRLFVSHNFL
jgi:hypothetical protein